MTVLEPPLSGDRFSVCYHLTGTHSAARETAEAICREQTVEVPDEIIPEGVIRDHIVGQVESFRCVSPTVYETVISFAIETAANELTQLLNVIFGNISLLPGMRVVRVDLPAGSFKWLHGPRFGRDGIRTLLGVPTRPLLCTALKPMGLSAKELADLAYQFALGGIDLIKDDHGLTDQPFALFAERVPRCAEAVARANRETGRRSLYLVNVTAPAGLCSERSVFAKQAGAGGLVISPGLTGWDTLRMLAADERIALPVLCHPALLGSFVAHADSGLSHSVLFGQLPRLAGADGVIFPSYGSRFPFSQDHCRSIVQANGETMGQIKPAFPVVVGGLTLERLPELIPSYGSDVILLIDGALRKSSTGVVETCRRFHHLVERISRAAL